MMAYTARVTALTLIESQFVYVDLTWQMFNLISLYGRCMFATIRFGTLFQKTVVRYNEAESMPLIEKTEYLVARKHGSKRQKTKATVLKVNLQFTPNSTYFFNRRTG